AGMLGAPVVANLIQAGFKAAVWNRPRSKTDPLAVQGARVAAGPVDCVKGADYILSILDSGPVVREVFFDSGAADAMKRGAVFIDMASIPPKMAQEHACRAQNCSLESLFLDDAEQHQPPACPTTCGRGQRFAVCCGPLLPRCGQGCCRQSLPPPTTAGPAAPPAAAGPHGFGPAFLDSGVSLVLQLANVFAHRKTRNGAA